MKGGRGGGEGASSSSSSPSLSSAASALTVWAKSPSLSDTIAAAPLEYLHEISYLLAHPPEKGFPELGRSRLGLPFPLSPISTRRRQTYHLRGVLVERTTSTTITTTHHHPYLPLPLLSSPSTPSHPVTQ
jgi:hypothetical protein